MKRLESNLLNMVLSLTLISLVAAGALGYVYMLTKEPIEQTNEANKLKAKSDVLPDVEGITFADAQEVDVDGNTVIVYKAFDADGEPVGAAVETFDKNGFNGLIRLMVGFDNEGIIKGYSVLEQGETPGLGANMVNWFKTDKNRQSIINLDASQGLSVTKDEGNVDAITAATITSRAFLRAINLGYAAFAKANDLPSVDITSGATKRVPTDSLSNQIDTLQVVEIENELPIAQPAEQIVEHITDTVIVG